MVDRLLPMIEPHDVYVEPFAGGASLFFAKRPSKLEVLNDTNQDLINLYWIAQTRKEEFIKYLDGVPYSEDWHSKAKNDPPKDDLERAVFFYINICMSFVNKLDGGFGLSKTHAEYEFYFNRLGRLNETIDRLKQTYLFNRDALDIIKRFDSPKTFYYCDPPYPNTDQGHYKGYTLDNFKELVSVLKDVEGSFMLSCYECMEMPKEWVRKSFKTVCHAQNVKGGQRQEREEVIYIKRSGLSKQMGLF